MNKHNNKSHKVPVTTASPSTQLREEIEQEVNHIAIGTSRGTMPSGGHILVPSLDLQQAVDRIMQKAEKSNLAARLVELDLLQQVIYNGYDLRPEKWMDDYISGRLKDLKERYDAR